MPLYRFAERRRGFAGNADVSCNKPPGILVSLLINVSCGKREYVKSHPEREIDIVHII